jgi:hypothetical protein
LAKDSSIDADRIRAAIEKLGRQRAVDKLLELRKVRSNPALATDPDYRRTFNGYYRMRQKSSEFYQHFFSMLQNAASADFPPTLGTILQELFNKTGQKHLSFGSKMLATITDDAVLFDRNLGAFFGVRSSPLIRRDWLGEALQRYEQVRGGIQRFTQRPDWPEMRALFDQAFPNAAHLPESRKADLIIWAAHDEL